MTKTEQIADIIVDWANERVDVAKRNLEGSNASRNLLQSIKASNISIEPNKISIGIIAADYYDFINKGVKGIGGSSKPLRRTSGKYAFKTPFVSNKMRDSIQKWIADKGIPIRKSKGQSTASVIKDSKTAAFLMARSIKRRGIEATYFWDNTFNEAAFVDLAERISGVLGEGFDIDINPI